MTCLDMQKLGNAWRKNYETRLEGYGILYLTRVSRIPISLRI